MATQVEELRNQMRTTQKAIQDLSADFKSGDKIPTVEDEAKLEGMINARADLQSQLERVTKFANAGATVAGAGDDGPNPMQRQQMVDVERRAAAHSIGERFIELPDFKTWLAGIAPNGNIGRAAFGRSPALTVKGLGEFDMRSALLTGESSTSAGAFVITDRYPELVELGRRPLTIRDLITVLQTSSDLVEFVKVTTETNAAAPVAEATASSGSSGVKPESTLAFSIVQTAVKTIAHWLPATRRSIADVPQLRGLVDDFLRYGLDEELEDQVVAGSGAGDNFTGLLQTSGRQTQAWDTNILTTTRKGRTKVRTIGRRNPTAYVLNPADWEIIDLLQDNEARYFFGGPANMGTPRLWGLPVIECEAMTSGVGMVADWSRAVLWDREDTQILVSDSHADFFIRNLVAILAEMRAAFGVLKPNAFVELDLTA